MTSPTPVADGGITILHLAVDFNTPQRPKTTTAVEWFVQELGSFDNVVVAWRRRPKPGNRVTECEAPGYRLYDFPYFGLPLGLDLLPAMWIAARHTIRRLEADGIRPDLVHAHKFTFEGLAAWFIARHFGVPYVVALRGEVETKVFRMKPELRGLLRKVARGAYRLYFVSAWFRDEFHRYVPGQEARERLFPNIVRNIQPVIAPQPPSDRFVCIAQLDTWKRKGLAWLFEAFAQALKQQPDMKLDVIGRGSPEAVAKVTALIARHGLESNVTVVGGLPNAELLARLPGYRALLLPSVNETFGMAFVEALFAGVPVLFTRGTAIDGYVDGLGVARTVTPGSVPEIADGILELWRDAEAYRARIAAAAPQLFAAFDSAQAIEAYRQDVRAAVSTNQL